MVQEVYPDGLIAQDGRLQPGDQIIEINGVDMTCSTHGQVSEGGRGSTVIKFGPIREEIGLNLAAVRTAAAATEAAPCSLLPPSLSRTNPPLSFCTRCVACRNTIIAAD